MKLDESLYCSSEKGLLCKTCSEAKVLKELSTEKIYFKKKLDLKHHVQQKSHLKAQGGTWDWYVIVRERRERRRQLGSRNAHKK